MADRARSDVDDALVDRTLEQLADRAGPTPDLMPQVARRAAVLRRRRVSGIGAVAVATTAAVSLGVITVYRGSDSQAVISVPAASGAAPGTLAPAGSGPGSSIPSVTPQNPWAYYEDNWDRTVYADDRCLFFDGFQAENPPAALTALLNTLPPPLDMSVVATAGGGTVVTPSEPGAQPYVEFTIHGRQVTLGERLLIAPTWVARGKEVTDLPTGSVLELDRFDEKVHLTRVDGTVWDVSFFAPVGGAPPSSEDIVQGTVALVTGLDARIPVTPRSVPTDAELLAACPLPASTD